MQARSIAALLLASLLLAGAVQALDIKYPNVGGNSKVVFSSTLQNIDMLWLEWRIVGAEEKIDMKLAKLDSDEMYVVTISKVRL